MESSEQDSQRPEATENPGQEEPDESSDSVRDGKKPMEKGKKERNRVSAQRCRMRKKQYVESLELQVRGSGEDVG